MWLSREDPIERLRARAAWYRALAAEAVDTEAAQSLLELANETDALIRAVEEAARRNNAP